jgi:hypothetical protein
VAVIVAGNPGTLAAVVAGKPEVTVVAGSPEALAAVDLGLAAIQSLNCLEHHIFVADHLR